MIYMLDKLKSISTHTPHARCNGFGGNAGNALTHFYSHTSCEVQLLKGVYDNGRIIISTHTPHARCNYVFVDISDGY